MNSNHFDFVIIGAGVVGLSVALELNKRNRNSRIAILEKEEQVAFHSSGRNSGVLHAGFYYTSDSLKAKFTKAGNQYWKQYCERKGLKINPCGKVVVTKNEDDLKSLAELFSRAEKNQVDLREISEQDAKKIDPRIKTFKKAAWSPSTAVINPIQAMQALAEDARQLGIQIFFETEYLGYDGAQVETNKGKFRAEYVINAAGLYADKIAQDFGFSKDYRILPFKGLYVYCTNESAKFNTNIYPVPNLKNPFLGVHHTLTVDGHSKIGPTAIPAFWREQYNGFERFKFDEILSIIKDELNLLFWANFDFRTLAFEEIRKYSRKKLVQEAALLAEGVRLSDYEKWGRPGIRAQLFNIKTKKLEMDFKFEADKKSLHILNAISPAFTCAQPFAEYVCDHIGKDIKA